MTAQNTSSTAATPIVPFTLDIELNTVDAFQGREKDVILISCVRGYGAEQTGSIGFLSDERRMNVALTRAKHALIVIGNAITLKGNTLWRAYIEHVENIQALYRLGTRSDIDLSKVLATLQASR